MTRIVKKEHWVLWEQFEELGAEFCRLRYFIRNDTQELYDDPEYGYLGVGEDLYEFQMNYDKFKVRMESLAQQTIDLLTPFTKDKL